MTLSARLPLDFIRSLSDEDMTYVQLHHGRLSRDLVRRAWAMAGMRGAPPDQAWLNISLCEARGQVPTFARPTASAREH